MLLWDGGLIQTEICRRKNKPCHVGAIQQITLDEGDIYTIGDDGSVRVWDFETIDTAEPSEEGVKLEIEPLNELKVGHNVSMKSMVKDFADESTIWYAQDSNGAIWQLDLSFMASRLHIEPSESLIQICSLFGISYLYAKMDSTMTSQDCVRKDRSRDKWDPSTLKCSLC